MYWDYDMNGDGFLDQRVHDIDGDGDGELWHIDSVGDGFYDQIGFDANGDGMLDTWFLDPNLDGWAETISLDTTGDGLADTSWAAPAGTTMGWEQLVAADPWSTASPPTPGWHFIGGTDAGWTIDGGSPVSGTEETPGWNVVGGTAPRPLDPIHELFVATRNHGDLIDQITVWNMIQSQNHMIDRLL
jgi:hypothetical protein